MCATGHRPGALGERVAARFLKRRGFRILRRNYVCPAGEADLIALDGREVVFVGPTSLPPPRAASPRPSKRAWGASRSTSSGAIAWKRRPAASTWSAFSFRETASPT